MVLPSTVAWYKWKRAEIDEYKSLDDRASRVPSANRMQASRSEDPRGADRRRQPHHGERDPHERYEGRAATLEGLLQYRRKILAMDDGPVRRRSASAEKWRFEWRHASLQIHSPPSGARQSEDCFAVGVGERYSPFPRNLHGAGRIRLLPRRGCQAS